MPTGFQHIRKAGQIAVGVYVGIADRIAHAGLCREVHDPARAQVVEQRSHRSGIGQVDVVDAHVRAQGGRAVAFQARIADRYDSTWQAELIERLGLSALLDRYPEQLSGGQQQRVAIGRALAIKPLVLLADEPTGNLDEATADEVLALARDLVARTGCGFLMVTHSARLAATLDRQVHLGAGRIT